MTRMTAYLADHPDLIPTLARWRWEEWGHITPDRSMDEWIEGLVNQANRDRIPVTLVAFDDDQPAGMASLVYYDMDTREDLTPWLASVLVEPSFRDRGHGSALVTAIEEIAAALDVETLYLYTNSAQSLYERLGWKEIEREPYRGREVVIMRKKLTG